MNLHTNPNDFAELIRLTAVKFNILPVYIEKDYWITRALQRMSMNPNTEKVVFKGGTSLSKAYRFTYRFSEDIDIAVIEADSFSGNRLKMLIKRLVKDMAVDMEEKIIQGVTSKGSRFYKAVYTYPNIVEHRTNTSVKTGQLLIEINTYANPYPYVKQEITSFITEYLNYTNQKQAIEQYNLQPFTLNVLDKRRTIVEKLVSLIRFSFSEDTIKALSAKIRHFYDLYYLANDEECAKYIQSADFKKDLSELLAHDQQEFDEPQGWQTKTVADSPLITSFPALWKNLRFTYQSELANLAFTSIPDEKMIADSFVHVMKNLTKSR
ncbi:MAG: nucleotidyl transferase AbiEii/AbiGii toxin family protein [Prevotellaceae bacterium]|nr:nucleotidyl transferase AbiEii/AbiGii toxin family protein [Prevotellaceae bacterium]